MLFENRRALSTTATVAAIVIVLVVAAGVALIAVPGMTSTKTITSTVTNTTASSSASSAGQHYKLALVLGGDETDVGLNANGVTHAGKVPGKGSSAGTIFVTGTADIGDFIGKQSRVRRRQTGDRRLACP